MRQFNTIALQALLACPLAAAASDPPWSPLPVSSTYGLDVGDDVRGEADCGSARCERILQKQRLQFGPAGGLGATLVTLPSYNLPGQPSRPNHGIGIRSHKLEGALNDMGIEARLCLAPVVRMHTKVSAGFDISGTLWVYLRCSFE